MTPVLLACILALLLLSACGDSAAVPPACLAADADDVVAALRTAPDDVALPDGTRLSTCVSRALDDAELQIVGATLTTAADRLGRRPGSDASAFRLGFLIGAVERGAARSNGVAAELTARMRQAVGRGAAAPARQAALRRGLAAGRQAG